MTRDEVDTMWQQAMRQSVEAGEVYVRYHFAKLVAERALADSMQEVQRLGQEIEQEPVAWMHIQGNYQESSFRQLDDWEIKNGFKQYPLYTHPPQSEQKPVAWQWLGSAHFRKQIPKDADVTAWNPLYTYPPQENT